MINGPGAELVKFGNAGHAVEDNARRFHRHHLAGAFVDNLIDALKDAKAIATITDHF